MVSRYVVFADAARWRIAVVDGTEVRWEAVSEPAEPSTTGERLEPLCDRLRALGYAGDPILLALPSAWCLAAKVATTGMEKGNRMQAIAFELEEALPVSAEDGVVGVAETGDDEALAVLVELARLRPLVDALEAAGIVVGPICPSALLAAAAARDAGDGEDATLVVRRLEGEASETLDRDLLEWAGHAPVGWWWLGSDERALAERLRRWTAEHAEPPTLGIVGPGEPTEAGPEDPGYRAVVSRREDAEAAAAERGAAILAGTARPWIDLRRGPLAARGEARAYRRPLAGLVLAVVALLGATIAVAQVRARAYASLAADYTEKQAEVFRRVLPEQQVPQSVRRRLESEKRKLAGLGGRAASGDAAGAIVPVSALLHLREVLESLPAEGGPRLISLQIGPDRVRVEGRAANYGSAEQLVRALRAAGPYEVAPPETRSVPDGGVRFVFTAQPGKRAAFGEEAE